MTDTCPKTGAALRVPVVLPRALDGSYVYTQRVIVVEPCAALQRKKRKEDKELLRKAMDDIRRSRQSTWFARRKAQAPPNFGTTTILSPNAPFYELVESVEVSRMRDACPACFPSSKDTIKVTRALVDASKNNLSTAIMLRARVGTDSLTPEMVTTLVEEYKDTLDGLRDAHLALLDLYDSALGPVARVPDTFPAKQKRFPSSTLYMCMRPQCGCVWKENVQNERASTSASIGAYVILDAVYQKHLEVNPSRSSPLSVQPGQPAFPTLQPGAESALQIQDETEPSAISDPSPSAPVVGAKRKPEALKDTRKEKKQATLKESSSLPPKGDESAETSDKIEKKKKPARKAAGKPKPAKVKQAKPKKTTARKAKKAKGPREKKVKKSNAKGTEDVQISSPKRSSRRKKATKDSTPPAPKVSVTTEPEPESKEATEKKSKKPKTKKKTKRSPSPPVPETSESKRGFADLFDSSSE